MSITNLRGTQVKDDSIFSDDIADGAVRGATANNGIQREVAAGTISTPDLRDEAITDAKVSTTAAIAESKLSLSHSTSSLNTAIGTKLSLAGGAMTGNIAMSGYKVTGLGAPTANGDALRYDQLGANSGIATLDSGGKVPVSQLPASIMEYKGAWNASTNTPTLADNTGATGDIYIVSVTGTQNLGSGNISVVAGDWIIHNGTIWEKSVNSASVSSVNGYTAVVNLVPNDLGMGTDDTVQFTSLGLGTTAGAYKLNVNGASQLSGNVDLYGDIYFKDDTKKILSLDQAKSVHVSNSGILLTGNVGIGVTPTEKLHTKTTSGDLVFLQQGASRTWGLRNQADGSYGLFDYTASVWRDLIEVATGDRAWFNNAGSEALRLTNAGNVGIGMTPQCNLDLEGAANITGGQFMTTARFKSTATAFSDRPGVMLGYNNAGTSAIIAAATQAAGQPLAFWTYNGSSWGERMRISSAGNVGIGTIAPDGQLGVQGLQQDTSQVLADFRANNTSGQAKAFQIKMTAGTPLVTLSTSAAGSDPDIAFAPAGTTRMSINTAGQLSMSSTTRTVAGLKCSNFGYSDGYPTLLVGGTASYGQTTVCINVDPIANTDGGFSGDGYDVMFRNGVSFMTPNAANNSFHNDVISMVDGKVGIGTGAPGATLHVDAAGGGIIRASRVGTGSNYIQMEADGTDGNLRSDGKLTLASGSIVHATLYTDGVLMLDHVGSKAGAGTGAINIGDQDTLSNSTGIYMRTSGEASFSTGGSTGYFTFYNNGAERFRISSAGYLTALGVYNQTSASAANVYVDSSGNIMRSTSSLIYKTDVADLALTDAEKLLNLRSITYKSLSASDNPDDRHYGFIAEEVALVDPLLIQYKLDAESNKVPDGVQYDRVVVGLLKLVQDLRARVIALENQ